jgi:DNA-binding NtrC family response regulator
MNNDERRSVSSEVDLTPPPADDGVEGTTHDEAGITLKVLIADSDSSLLENCRRFVTHAGHECDTIKEAGDIRSAIANGGYDLALLHDRLLAGETEAILRLARDVTAGPMVIVTSDQASDEGCRSALASGAWDYLPKPFSSGQLTSLLGRAAHSVRQTRQVRLPGDDGGVQLESGLAIFGISPQIRDALEKALRVAPTDAPVLLTGESGTGKELFARLIHERSRRAKVSFSPLNCAALPGDLLESEMFGHRRGAFTGAVRDKVGILEAAHKGTVFLDEVGEMPVGLQAKLLRVVEDGALRRVGSEEVDRTVDVRIISATNRDPKEAVATGKLREDLLYRLGVVNIHLAPLRERPEDTLVLARHLTPTLWKQYRPSAGPPPTLSDDALEALQSHPWPGNVRELMNVLGHAVIFGASGRELRTEDLSLPGHTNGNGSWNGSPNGGGNGELTNPTLIRDLQGSYHEAKDRMLARFERAYLSRIISGTGGNLCEASRQADINRTTLYRLMEKHDLSREDLVKEA